MEKSDFYQKGVKTMFYESFSSAIYTLLFWWGIFLVLHRITNRYYKNHPWKRDIIVTFIQSIVVLVLLPVLDYFL